MGDDVVMNIDLMKIIGANIMKGWIYLKNIY